MTLIVGPNGIPFECNDPVVASGLLGSASGAYKRYEAEPAGEAGTVIESPATGEQQESGESAPEGDKQPEGDKEPEGDKPEDDKAPADVEQPAGNASSEAWVEYALAQGKTPDELDGLTRNQVRDLFTKE